MKIAHGVKVNVKEAMKYERASSTPDLIIALLQLALMIFLLIAILTSNQEVSNQQKETSNGNVQSNIERPAN